MITSSTVIRTRNQHRASGERIDHDLSRRGRRPDRATRAARPLGSDVGEVATRSMWPVPPWASAVPGARRLLRHELTRLGQPLGAVDDAEIVLSELLTNAIRHARPAYELRLHATTGLIVCEIIDSSYHIGPRPCPLVMVDAPSSRGLRLVDTLTRGLWGVRPTWLARPPGGPAKSVWFAQPRPGRAP